MTTTDRNETIAWLAFQLRTRTEELASAESEIKDLVELNRTKVNDAREWNRSSISIEWVLRILQDHNCKYAFQMVLDGIHRTKGLPEDLDDRLKTWTKTNVIEDKSK